VRTTNIQTDYHRIYLLTYTGEKSPDRVVMGGLIKIRLKAIQKDLDCQQRPTSTGFLGEPVKFVYAQLKFRQIVVAGQRLNGVC